MCNNDNFNNKNQLQVLNLIFVIEIVIENL
ncbi:MAG: hypothetical protein RI980_1786 [Bacteroidota bacterium]|jgi:hypothetical protein